MFAFCTLFFDGSGMANKKYFLESELGMLAKSFRQKAGKRIDEAALELKVGRPSVQLAEGDPEQSLTKLRIRMIEKYSPYQVVGRVFLLKRK
jgi:hypothetical protein